MTNFMVNGNVCRAAKTRMTVNSKGQQTLVTDFNLAVNDGFGDNQIVTYYKVTIWGQPGANLEKFLTVGKEVNVKGIPGQEKAWIGEDGLAHSGAQTIRWAQVELKGKKTDSAEVFTGEEVEE